MPNPPEPPLSERVVLLARGDGNAFDLVYRALYGPVRDTVLRILKDPAQAAEVAHDVLIEVWLHAGRYDPADGSALAWSLAIARHRAIDRVRSEHAAAVRDTLFAARSTSVPYDEVVDLVEQRLDHESLRLSLATLPEPQCEALLLVYFEGLSIAEAADRLGLPLTTLKSRLSSARAALRRGLTGF